MSLKYAAEFSVGHQFLFAYFPCRRPQRIKKRRSVAFGEYQTVIIGKPGVICVKPEESAKHKTDEQVRSRQRGRRMARTGFRSGNKDKITDKLCEPFQLFFHFGTF